MKRVLLFITLLAGCDSRPDQWDAFVYPDADNLLVDETIRGFKTFELCQQAAISRIRSMPSPDNASYECGYRCEYRPDWDVNVCKETRR